MHQCQPPGLLQKNAQHVKSHNIPDNQTIPDQTGAEILAEGRAGTRAAGVVAPVGPADVLAPGEAVRRVDGGDGRVELQLGELQMRCKSSGHH